MSTTAHLWAIRYDDMARACQSSGARRSGCGRNPKTSPVAFVSCSIPAEAAVELPVVSAVHVAVAIEVEVPQVAGVGGARPERGPEEVAIQTIDVPVAVAVAEEPEEAVHPVASR